MPLAAHVDYPNSYAELRAWFDQDWKFLDYLGWLCWPNGFICPRCGGDRGWRGPRLAWTGPALAVRRL